jgi:tight adherence protein C
VRVCGLSQGQLANELRQCLADARAGANLPVALQGLADRTGLASLARFVDGIVVAVECVTASTTSVADRKSSSCGARVWRG